MTAAAAAQAGTAHRPVALFVLGMPRSGTSALTRVLSLCGGRLPASLLAASPSNPLGHFEPRAAICLNDAILNRHDSSWYDPSLRLQDDDAFTAVKKGRYLLQIKAFLHTLPVAPLIVIKEPRITALSGLWFEAARLAGFDIATVVAVRHPEEVIASLTARDGIPAELSGALWLKYNLLAERHTRALPRAFVEYPNLLEDWRREISRVSAALAVDLSTADDSAINEFIKRDFQNQRHSGPVPELCGTDWMSTVYDAVHQAARGRFCDSGSLDSVFEAYRTRQRDFQLVFDDFRARAARDWVSRQAQDCFVQGDLVNARKWYAKRAELGGADEEVYSALYGVAESMRKLDEPWPAVEEAYLHAWRFRPTRAEPLLVVAGYYALQGLHERGYLFARRAAEIPFPRQDKLSVRTDVYAWRSAFVQAVCAAGIGRQAETFMLCRRLLTRPDIPDAERSKIAGLRDLGVPAMLDAASSFPDAVPGELVGRLRDGEVTVTLVAGPERTAAERTLNSFLHCCTDVSAGGRILVVDVGLSSQDRAVLAERYRCVELVDSDPVAGQRAPLDWLRDRVKTRWWLHLGQGWQFFAPEDLITRLLAVLKAEPRVFQVGINFSDATRLTGTCAPEQVVHRAAGTGRYVLTDTVASGPAMFDTARLDRVGGIRAADSDPIIELQRRATAAGLCTATLDEVLSITAG